MERALLFADLQTALGSGAVTGTVNRVNNTITVLASPTILTTITTNGGTYNWVQSNCV